MCYVFYKKTRREMEFDFIVDSFAMIFDACIDDSVLSVL